MADFDLPTWRRRGTKENHARLAIAEAEATHILFNRLSRYLPEICLLLPFLVCQPFFFRDHTPYRSGIRPRSATLGDPLTVDAIPLRHQWINPK
jgi:hypothetical protein